MSTATVQRHRWTREEYERVVEAGGFDPEDRVELLDGEIWDVTPQGTRHGATYSAMHMALQRAFGDSCYARCQLPFPLDDSSMPEPDIAMVRGAPADHVDRYPTEALLLVEVSVSSLRHDRGLKLSAYARGGIPEYWVVDVEARQLEVYRDPAGSTYRSVTVLTRAESVSPLHAPDATIAVADMLP